MNIPEFTGERYIPGMGGAQIAYEHLHRYLFAARWARGKRVLDVATGAGYGAALLARCARIVYATDLDESSLHHARRRWTQANLKFFHGDATLLPLRSGSVEIVVAMEVLEHLPNQEELVREIARVCGREGIALISTPNKAVYSDARAYTNPFHVREFCREEFVALLRRNFQWVQVLTQQVRAGSLISGNGAEADLYEIITDPSPAGCGPAIEPMYFLAICGQRRMAQQAPLGSAYLDLTDSLFLEWVQEVGRLNGEIKKLGYWGKDLEETISQRDQTLCTVLQEVAARDRSIVALQERLSEEIEQRDEYIRQQQDEYAKLRAEFDERGHWAKGLEDRVADRDSLLQKSNAELSRVGNHLARIRHHLLYRILCRLGLLPK